MQPGRAGEPDQPRGIAADTRGREVDQAPTAAAAIRLELAEDQRLVAGELPVIPAVRDVPQGDLGVLVRQREPEVRRVDRAEDGLDMGHRGPMLRGRDGLALGRCGREQHVHDGARAAEAVLGPVTRPGLDALQQQPVEQCRECARRRVDVEP